MEMIKPGSSMSNRNNDRSFNLRQVAIVVASSSVLFLSACSDSGTSTADTDPLQPGGVNAARSLRLLSDAGEFSDSLRGALINHHGGGTNLEPTGIGAPAVPQASPSIDEAVTSESASDSSGADGAGTGGNADFTTTNVQEIGVDEADRIKSDGQYLYVLDDQYNYGPQPIDGGIDVIADSSIAAPPSSVRLRVLQLDSAAADATLISETELGLQGHYVDGMYLTGNGSESSLVVTAAGFGGGYWGYWDTPSYWGNSGSSIRKLSVGDPGNPAVSDTVTIDGQIVSSRVVDNRLYLASRYFPVLEGVNPYDPSVSYPDLVQNADINDLLPQFTRESDGLTQPLASAGNCFVSDTPESAYYVPDIVTLAVINLDDLSLSDSVCYLGSTETLYASPNAVYLATTSYNYGIFEGDVIVDPVPLPVGEPDVEPVDGAVDEPDVVSQPITQPIPPSIPSTTTEIHQFDFVDGGLQYRGTGTVLGHLGWNADQRPFRMSERNGVLRVATYNDSNEFGFIDDSFNSSASGSPVFLTVLQPGDGSRLQEIARLPNEQRPAHIGKPGEQLYASRFLGDKAYLVTFRQTDPLYVIDLSDPSSPFLAGELEIEGYSDYLHPVGENHLLGLGKGAIPDTSGFGDGGRGAFTQGVKVSLFDVSNPADPREVQSLEIGKRGTESSALYDHHGITYRPERDGEPGRLAFSIDVADIPPDFFDGPRTWYFWRESGLHAFEIRTGDDAGISDAGKIIVEAATPQMPWGPQRGNDRSLFVDDAVFYVHGEQVYGARWGDLGNFNGPR